MQLIDGKATAAAIKEQIAQEVAQIVAAGGKQPHLVAVLVGHDGGSETYVKNKVLACEKCGFKSTLIRYEEDVTEEELLQCVDKLNQDDDVDGFIVQLPLPKHIDEQKVTMGIIAIYVVSTFAGGWIMGKLVGEKRFFWGLLLGIIYFALLLLVSVAVNHNLSSNGTNIVTTMILCAGGGMIGGMVS